jgi:hypothetical protein
VDRNAWRGIAIALLILGNNSSNGDRVACRPPFRLSDTYKMSSVTFPNASHYSLSSVHSNDEDGVTPYDTTFGTPHGIQMNPLSPHPPRTPRTSTAYSGGYELPASSPKRISASLDVEPEEERANDQPAKTQVRSEEVWREIVKTSDGRDKAFVCDVPVRFVRRSDVPQKLIQYSVKLYLLCHATFRARQSALKVVGTLEKSILRRLGNTVSALSLTRRVLPTEGVTRSDGSCRRCLLLFNWLGPLTTILAQQSVPYSSESTSNNAGQKKTRPFIYALMHTPPPVLLDLVNAIADDLYTYSRIGLVGIRTGSKAAKFADWCWFVSTIVNLVENAMERGVMKDLQHQGARLTLREVPLVLRSIQSKDGCTPSR